VILCRVIGSVLQRQKTSPSGSAAANDDRPLLIVQPVDDAGRRIGGEIVAEACVRTTVGDLVLVDPDRRGHDASAHVPPASVQAAAIAVVEGLGGLDAL